MRWTCQLAQSTCRLSPWHHRREPMGKTTLEWSQEIDRRLESLVSLRRDFHRHPELSFQEHRTAQIIAERLHTAGFEVHTNIGGTTAVMGILHGDKPGRTIAWRADIDALPLTELLEAPFTSGTPGVMHACGHDGHTAIAITLADIHAARRAGTGVARSGSPGDSSAHCAANPRRHKAQRHPGHGHDAWLAAYLQSDRAGANCRASGHLCG